MECKDDKQSKTENKEYEIFDTTKSKSKRYRKEK